MNFIIPEQKRYQDLDLKLQMNNLIINVFYISFEPGGPDWIIGNHCHNTYELHFIPYGRGVLRIDQESYDIVPETFYVTGPGVYHKQIFDSGDPMAECCINFDLIQLERYEEKRNHEFLQPEVDLIARTFCETPFWFGRDDLQTHELFRKIRDEFENRYIGYHANICSLIIEVIVNAVRCFTRHQKATYEIPGKSLEDNKRQILDFSMEYEFQTISIEEIARRLGVSVRQAERVIKQYFGMSFREKMNDTRLKQAKHRLRETNLPIEQVAEEVGFKNTTYFRALFKSAEQMTPQEYRKRYRKMGGTGSGQ